MIDFRDKVRTTTGNYCLMVLSTLREKLWKGRKKFSKRTFSVRNWLFVMQRIRDLGLKLLQHALYSIDLALSDYHVFPTLEKEFDR